MAITLNPETLPCGHAFQMAARWQMRIGAGVAAGRRVVLCRECGLTFDSVGVVSPALFDFHAQETRLYIGRLEIEARFAADHLMNGGR